MLLCPRKYQHQVILKTEGQGNPKARNLGTALHQALAHHYLKFSMPDYFTDEQLAEPSDAIILSLGKTSEQLKHAQYLWDQYIKTYPWSVDSQQFEVLEVESELFIKIDGEDYCQRADLVTRRKSDGKVYIWDHKTMGGFGQQYGVDQFALSGQILGLQWIGRELYGRDFGGCLINGIRTSPTNQAQRFFRQEPPASPGAVSEFPLAIIHARKLIAEYESTGYYPKVLDGTVCHAYGGCDHLQNCRFI
jgi:hypothetical protein